MRRTAPGAGIILSCILLLTGGTTAAQEGESEGEEHWFGSRTHSWEMEEVVVQSEKESRWKEEQRIGPYGQPRWTAIHQNVTAVYVRPPGLIEMLVWVDFRVPRDDADHTEISTIYEVEIGLPYRLQLDLFLETLKTGGDSGSLEVAGQSVELRWAPADWGKIWGNPTVYLEYYYARNQRPNEIEAKLLLGGQIAPGWHWGANFLYEQELGGEEEREYTLKLSISKTVIDEELSLGIGGMVGFEEEEEDGEVEWEAVPMLGPRVRWSPLPALHLDAVAFFGLTEEAPLARPIFLLSWEF